MDTPNPPAREEFNNQTQQQVVAEIDTLIDLIEQLQQMPKPDENMETTARILLHTMDRLQQQLVTPFTGCEGQTSSKKKRT